MILAEPFSALSHLIGAVVAMLATGPLLRRAAPGERTALVVFAVGAVVLLLASGVYHAFPEDTGARALFRRLDHAAIFVLIAATFTPIHELCFRGPWRWGMLLFVWIAAVVGVVLKLVLFASIPAWLGVSLYVLFGWVGLASAIRIGIEHGARPLCPLIVGAILYTAGAAALGVFALGGDPELVEGVGGHELFHVLVLGGLAAHWRFVGRIADGHLRCGSRRHEPASRPTS